MIIDYTVSITTLLSAIPFCVGGVVAFSRVLSQLRDLSADVKKLDSVPISIATLELKIVFLEKRIDDLEKAKFHPHVAA